MADNVDTSNGRHWSEPVDPAAPDAPPTVQDGHVVGEQQLPGRPPTSSVTASNSDQVATPRPRPTPPPTPALVAHPQNYRTDGQGVAPQPRPPQQTPWGQPQPTTPPQPPAPQPNPQLGQQPPWAPAATPHNGTAPPPAPPWQGQVGADPRAVPNAAPRRQFDPAPPPEGAVVGEDRGWHGQGAAAARPPAGAMPRPGAAQRGPAEPDQYRRPAAPMQAASAGIRQELVTAANEERNPVANTGWRGAMNKTGMKLKPSKKERKRRDVYARIRAPKEHMYAIAVLTLKGGAGKTTVTSVLGQVFSSIRADSVVAVDADPDAGDLPMRTAVHRDNLSMMDLVGNESLNRLDIVERFLSTTETDLQVLANGWRPDSDRVMEPEDVLDVHEILSHYYSMLIWDGDKALNSTVVRAMLDSSHALVLLVEASRPGAMKAGQAIDWLRNHGYEGLLARTVLVINETTQNTRLDLDALKTVLARQQLKLHQLPFDPHLDEGLFIDLDKLKKKTRRAFEDLAAVLADDFSVPQPPAPIKTAS